MDFTPPDGFMKQDAPSHVGYLVCVALSKSFAIIICVEFSQLTDFSQGTVSPSTTTSKHASLTKLTDISPTAMSAMMGTTGQRIWHTVTGIT